MKMTLFYHSFSGCSRFGSLFSFLDFDELLFFLENVKLQYSNSLIYLLRRLFDVAVLFTKVTERKQVHTYQFLLLRFLSSSFGF